MKMVSGGTIMYVVAVGFLLFWAYFVQNDTRRVDGFSMLPTLEGGDLIVIQNTQIVDIHVGDIIVYSSLCSTEGLSVVHRVVQVTSAGLITKGDNNPGTDQASDIAYGPITQECLEGKVVFVIPYVELLAYYVDYYNLPWWVNYLPSFIIIVIMFVSLLFETQPEPGRGGREKETGRPPTSA